MQQESSTLDTKAKREIAGLVGSKEARILYVNNPELPITKLEALGAIIVGAKQGPKGVTRQKGVVAETLEWAFERLFYDQASYRTVTDEEVQSMLFKALQKYLPEWLKVQDSFGLYLMNS